MSGSRGHHLTMVEKADGTRAYFLDDFELIGVTHLMVETGMETVREIGGRSFEMATGPQSVTIELVLGDGFTRRVSSEEGHTWVLVPPRRDDGA